MIRALTILLALGLAPAAAFERPGECDLRDPFNLPQTEILYKSEMVKLGYADILRAVGYPCEHVWHITGDVVSCFVGNGEAGSTESIVYIVRLDERGEAEVLRQ